MANSKLPRGGTSQVYGRLLAQGHQRLHPDESPNTSPLAFRSLTKFH